MSDIKEKIRKLLNLASSPYEGEAMAALLKAKELMAKHKLTEADFEEAKKQEMVHLRVDEIKWTTDSGEVWIAELCRIISENYCCVTCWNIPYRTRTHILQVTGMQEDAELCTEVIKYAVGFVRGAVKDLQRRYRREDPKSVMVSYATGFMQGLELAYECQKEEHPEWGLVIVKPEEVRQFEEGLSSRSVRTHKTAFNPTAHLKGFNDGKEFNPQRVLK